MTTTYVLYPLKRRHVADGVYADRVFDDISIKHVVLLPAEVAIEHRIAVLRACSEVVVMEGWEECDVASNELAVALRTGLPVVYLVKSQLVAVHDKEVCDGEEEDTCRRC